MDPYALAPLPFTVIEKLAKVPRLDLLGHFSEYDLRLTLDFNVTGHHDTLDRTVPGWRERIDPLAPADRNRAAIRDLWCEKVSALGKPVRGYQLVRRGANVQYYLFLFSEHELAKKFWDALEASRDQKRLL